MKAWIVRVMLAVALISAGYMWGHTPVPVVHAQVLRFLPKTWGHLVGEAPGGGLLFEDPAGTIRVVSMTGQVALEITRN